MQEQWARAFEGYLRTGEAPTVGLKRVFEQFKTWLTSIYRSFSDLGVDLSPEMKGVFDRMLGAADEAAPTSPKQPGPKLMNAEQVGRFKAASDATKLAKQTAGKVGKIIQSDGMSGGFKMPDEGVAKAIWGKGPTGAANVKATMEASNGKAKPAIEEAAILSLRPAFKDGVINPDGLERWRNQHASALAELPELDKRLQSAAKATKAMEEIGQRRKAAMDPVQKSAIGKLLKLNSDADVTATVGGMLGKSTAVKDLRTLVGVASKNPEAIAGLRRAVVDYMLNRFTSSKDAVSAAAFLKFLGKNHPALSEVMTPAQMSNLRALAQEVKRATKEFTAPGGGSQTAENIASMRKHVREKPSLLRKFLAQAAFSAAGGAVGWFHSPIVSGISFVASALGSVVIQSAREAGLRRVDELIQEAVLNPELMKALLAKAPNKANVGSHRTVAATLGKIGAFAAMAGAE